LVSPVVKEKSYFAPDDRRCRDANPAEQLICGNAGIREDLGASSRNSGLPRIPASSRISSRTFPGESLKKKFAQQVRTTSSAGGEDEGYFALGAGDAGSNPAAGIVPAWLNGKAPNRTFVADSPAD
jgi:hypothetical protein